jgi:Mrp family chromosome partitioning ATPase
MESINFAAALWRSWRLLLLLAVVGAVIAAILPLTRVKQTKPVLHYKAVSIVGAVPKGGSGLIGGGVTSAQIAFYGNSVGVQRATAERVKQDIPIGQLSKYMAAAVGVTSKKDGTDTSSSTPTKGKNNQSNLVTLTGYGKTKENAINLVNKYAYVLNVAIAAVAEEQAQRQAQAKSATKPTTQGTPGTSTASTTPGSATSSSGSTSSASPAPIPIDTGYTIESSAFTATRVPSVSGGKLDSHKVRALIGFLLGLIVGALIAIARVLLDKRIRNASQAASSFGAPVIVEIPARPAVSADQRAAPVDVSMQPGSVEAEAYRKLRMSVLFETLGGSAAPVDPLGLALAGNGHGAFGAMAPAVPELGRWDSSDRQIVLVVSPDGEETRPLVAANLAAVYAEAEQRVIVASTAELGVGRPEPMGNLGGLWTGDIRPVDVEARLGQTRVDNVVHLPLTLFMQNSGQLVTRGRQLLDAARSVCDVIIIETPGLLSVHHAEALSHAVDVVVVVGECESTRISDAKKSSEILHRVGAPVLGVVLTNVPSKSGPRARSRRSGVAVPVGPVTPPAVVPTGRVPVAEDVNAVGSDEPTARTQV